MSVVRIDAEPRVIVEPARSGGYAVSLKPFFSAPDLERVYRRAWEALEYAEMLGLEFGWTVIDRTEVRV